MLLLLSLQLRAEISLNGGVEFGILFCGANAALFLLARTIITKI
uniref:Uncharacterized protein n=1 Tax=Meloidogyne enterolobii TaxID=390850 RepID=A0A6V7TKH9_MELEN|nr:unnamed protein product [Meloidogyne enterolobii]